MVKAVPLDVSTLLVDLEGDFNIVSTAGCPKLFSSVRYIVFRSVPKNFEMVDLDSYCKKLAESIGVDYERSTIFLTSVNVMEYSYSRASYGEAVAEAFVTFGVDTPSCIDRPSDERPKPFETINTAVVVNKPLSHLGLIDLFRLASEVKGVAIALGGPMCMHSASIGTASDAIAVAAPPGEERFAGIATDVGIATAIAVANALAKHLRKISRDKYLANSLGFDRVESIVDLAINVYRKAPIPCIDESRIREEILIELRETLLDPNIVMFVRGLRLLEAALSLGVVPVTDLSEYEADAPSIIVDELAGKALAEYMSGFKGFLTYYWIERLKEGGELEYLERLPPITDDIVGALIGGILSKIYDRYSRSCPSNSGNIYAR